MAAFREVPGRWTAASCFFEVGRREIGSSSPRASSRRISGSEGLILRMNQYGQLRGHGGCVNSVSFNPAGDILVSGSDDTDVILWDWFAKARRLGYPSGHEANVLHARVMPFTHNSAIVTAAADGQGSCSIQSAIVTRTRPSMGSVSGESVALVPLFPLLAHPPAARGHPHAKFARRTTMVGSSLLLLHGLLAERAALEGVMFGEAQNMGR